MSNASDKELLKHLNQSDKQNSLVVCRFLDEKGKEMISYEFDFPKSTISCDEDEISEAELLKDLSLNDEESIIRKRSVDETGEVVGLDLPNEDGRGELRRLSKIESPDKKKKRQSESQVRTDLRRLTNAEETGNSSSEILLVHASPELFDVSVVSGSLVNDKPFSEHTHETITTPYIPEIQIKINTRIQKAITRKLKAKWNT